VHFASSTAGRGSTASDRERVFQPFQQLGDQDSQGGVGLGLAVARGFVEAVEGTIVLDDTPRCGA
jgi:two-component system sensor histidine kinase KdpD